MQTKYLNFSQPNPAIQIHHYGIVHRLHKFSLLYIFLEFWPNQPNLAIQTHHNGIVHRLHKSSFAMHLSGILKTWVYMSNGFPFYLVLKTDPTFGEAYSQQCFGKVTVAPPCTTDNCITACKKAHQHILYPNCISNTTCCCGYIRNKWN